MFFKLRYLLLFLFLFLFSLLTAMDLARANEPKNKPHIKIGVMALAPYGYQLEKGKWIGNHYEIAHAFLDAGVFKGAVSVYPVSRLIRSLIGGKLDCVISGAVPFAEANYGTGVNIGQDLEFGILPAKHIHLKKYEDLKGISIAVSFGTKLSLPFDEDKTLNKVDSVDYAKAALMLHYGREDSVAGVLSSVKYSAKIAGLDNFEHSSPFIFQTVPVKFYCMKDSPVMAAFDEIRSLISSLREQGHIERILQKYK